MIELTTAEFLALLGLSGLQLATLGGIFLRLGRVGARLDDHHRRIETLEGNSHAPVSARVPA